MSADVELLESLEANIMLYVPGEADIYPNPQSKEKIYDLNGLDRFMEGEHRPGHFNGVALVVDRLFDIVGPNRAYFGEKDFQQLAVIRHMAKMAGHNIEIVACATVRATTGLALSSRNKLLKPQQLLEAPKIYQTIKEAQNLLFQHTIDEVKTIISDQINSSPYFNLDYFEIAHASSLQPAQKLVKGEEFVACIAVLLATFAL
ncbi:MAG: 4-phosphopantoate--beta-alanine ligase [Bacteroidales bacterium]|nr:4-phosphopantoate--beta-alanine ligase [Bacteroidales bacterium]